MKKIISRLTILFLLIVGLYFVSFDFPIKVEAEACCESCEAQEARCEALYNAGSPAYMSCVRTVIGCLNNCTYCGSGGGGIGSISCTSNIQCVGVGSGQCINNICQ